MTIPSTTERNDYVGNGATSVFPYTFRILDESEIRVVTRDTDGVEEVLVIDTDYTVDGVGESGGNVTLVAGALTDDYALTIRRNPPLTQLTDIRNAGDFHPEVHEDQFDRLVMLIQMLKDEVDRSIKILETEAGGDFTLKIAEAASRASKFISFDSEGNVALSNGTGTAGLYPQELASDPSPGSPKQIYWHTGEGILKFFDGTTAYGVALVA